LEKSTRCKKDTSIIGSRRQVARLPLQLDLAGPPGFVEPRIERPVKPQDHEPGRESCAWLSPAIE
jgi:hypothetical protein